ncbi:peptidoglycan-recognition protein SC2-like [Macrosteles quadrilineatus]|uniref:peptidoglycan-recognition protein SC2-like n=1 Tax=Macrosteles quadrilineatus TaxID=74068 RepID=UPI0023E24194|nr:peptidoglycan-recognition protein SC2-like [Macrosteles quadrilineatus]
MVPNIIVRENWGAMEPTVRRYLPLPVSNVAVHHWTPVAFNKKNLWEPCTTKEECMERCRTIQKMAMEWPYFHSDIGFNFLVGGDLNVYEGRGWNSLLTEDSYWDGLKIGLIGRWNQHNPAPDSMKEVVYQLIDFGKKRQYIKNDAYVFDTLFEIIDFED